MTPDSMFSEEQLLKATSTLADHGSDPAFILGEQFGIDPELILAVAQSYAEYTTSPHVVARNKALEPDLESRQHTDTMANFMVGFMVAVQTILGEKDD